ncbi:hypothetical protein PR202_ga17246 [Eleusine coracana subsp. coracana]|uniref:Bifunctional inhibitor/plant lipid transfer protein/seed storage helical domain-containing protein n=1 Tax=Eleusine coracana subsp. coracana TaxID=191504 RepID=A0AAV5CNG6_ELECO|nr:hypothetical protein PR202_ga17246 [Eleusine coracana subsp. coracana]
MASSKFVALFLAFAMAAAILQPSEARPQILKPDCAAQHGQAPHPAPVGSPGTTISSPPSPPAQPTECLTPLLGMMPCMDYLTNLTVLTPPTTCCDGLKAVIKDAPVCLCHGMNGDMNSFMPKPIDPVRMMMLPLVCGTTLPLQTIFSCNTLTVPPIMAPVAPVAPTPSP